MGREYSKGLVTIFEYERGLLYTRGAFQRIMAPGCYRIWPFTKTHIKVLDVRQTSLTISAQKIFTSDPLPVTVSLSVDYRIDDAARSVHEHKDVLSSLYEVAQRAVRGLIAVTEIADLLGSREAINDGLLPKVYPWGEPLGLEILRVDIKDVTLVASVRDLMTKEAEQKLRARAALAAAREEVATLRALSNAARMVRDNPELLKLREMDLVAELARGKGNTLVMNSSGSALGLTPLPGRSETPDGPVSD